MLIEFEKILEICDRIKKSSETFSLKVFDFRVNHLDENLCEILSRNLFGLIFCAILIYFFDCFLDFLACFLVRVNEYSPNLCLTIFS